MSNKNKLNLNDIKNNVNDPLAPTDDVKEAIAENKTIQDLDEELKNLEKEEAESKAEKKASDVATQLSNDAVFNQMQKEVEEEEKAKEIMKEADDKAKEMTTDLLSDENIVLDNDQLLRKKDAELRDKKEREERIERLLTLKQSFKDNIIQKNVVDLSEFRISKTPVSISKIFSTDMGDGRIGAWGLYYSGQSIAMDEIGGPEMETIAQETSSNDLIDQIQTFRYLHKHAIDPNKGTLEEWLQKFSYLDLPDLFFAAYKASFNGSNYVSYNCTNDKCKHPFMKAVSMKDMVVYPEDDPSVKERMDLIINKDPSTKNLVQRKLVPISDKYAMFICVPTIYKIIFEQRMLPQDFRSENEDLVNTLLYIDEILQINKEDKMLHPIDTRPDPSNHNLSVRRKVVIYSKILAKLTSDQYMYLTSVIQDYNSKYVGEKAMKRVTYQFPEAECPKCHTKIEKAAMEPLTMLFLRHRLGRVMSITKS